ncbi:MAG TPA: [LysW]-aminoadipate/[LysW]-glutamate kinase [Nitrososphaeraceae archaeon]|nr:[LysW]-aminoadipate/[LysW]-glutamate kinase [Nitrososphaeraceae archaeon]
MIVIKFGGSVLYELHPSIIEDLHQISKNERMVLVHGGGNEVTNMATKLGKEQKFIVSPSGIRSRFTDKETAEIYTMVMSGKINKIIVKMMVEAGIKAVGISGIDAGILRAIRKSKLTVLNEKGRKMIIEGGYTGKIQSVETSLLNILTEKGYLPVVSPIALSENYEFLNVDGDRAAAYIAGNLKADKVIFLTNVNGLHLDDKLVKSLTASQAKESMPKIGFGMEKKILASTEALMLGAKEVIISSGKVLNPITSAISHEDCTVISN